MADTAKDHRERNPSVWRLRQYFSGIRCHLDCLLLQSLRRPVVSSAPNPRRQRSLLCGATSIFEVEASERGLHIGIFPKCRGPFNGAGSSDGKRMGPRTMHRPKASRSVVIFRCCACHVRAVTDYAEESDSSSPLLPNHLFFAAAVCRAGVRRSVAPAGTSIRQTFAHILYRYRRSRVASFYCSCRIAQRWVAFAKDVLSFPTSSL